jgi:RNA polymerase primary sigma factor
MCAGKSGNRLTSAAVSEYSGLGAYLRDIRGTVFLLPEEARQLPLRVRQGSLTARARLVRAYLWLVVGIARRYVGSGLPLEDLVAEGNLGLLRAADRFDPARNAHFTTFAQRLIRQHIQRAVHDSKRIVRLPVSIQRVLVKWTRAERWLRSGLGRSPTEDEVAGHLNLSTRKLRLIREARRACLGSSGQRGDDDMPPPFVDERSTSPLVRLVERDDLCRVAQLLARLEARQATVLRLRFGLDGGEPQTLGAVAQHLGLSRERVRQLEVAALGWLRRRMAGYPDAT